MAFNATTTTLTPSTVSGTHGTSITLNVSVSPSSGGGVPSGDIALQATSNSTISPGFLTLTNGSVTAQVSNLPGANYNLTAPYGEDAPFAASNSSPIQVTITPESSSTVASMVAAGANGQAVPFTTGPFGGFLYIRADVAGQ